MRCNFNDTSLEKAKAFSDIKTFLAVGVWDKMADLLFIVYGKKPEIGEYVTKKVCESKQASRRFTQTISVRKLVKIINLKFFQ
ncbi:hypothetical protein DTQ32_01675 [Ureaplasma parvum]|nr:hypothetical protein DTQ32_01675 [Ureaplasma parvum]